MDEQGEVEIAEENAAVVSSVESEGSLVASSAAAATTITTMRLGIVALPTANINPNGMGNIAEGDCSLQSLGGEQGEVAGGGGRSHGDGGGGEGKGRGEACASRITNITTQSPDSALEIATTPVSSPSSSLPFSFGSHGGGNDFRVERSPSSVTNASTMGTASSPSSSQPFSFGLGGGNEGGAEVSLSLTASTTAAEMSPSSHSFNFGSVGGKDGGAGASRTLAASKTVAASS